jgi:hypothetical protein
MLPYLCSAFLRMDERTRVCPNCRSCTVYSLGFNRIQIHRSHIEGVHQSVNNNRIVTYIGPISFKMCGALQHTTFCLKRHNFWHYALVNPLNYYFVLFNLK